MPRILEIRNLEKYYGNKGNITKAVNGISFCVYKGEFIGIMGASGSGKTTLLKGIKQHSKIKGFVQIPIQKLVNLITYKAELLGIEVNLVKEYYTSGVSAYDLESVDIKHYNINRRVKRGLFRTNEGHLVDSDINGSLNIMRRYEKNVVPIVVANLIGLVATELLLAYVT